MTRAERERAFPPQGCTDKLTLLDGIVTAGPLQVQDTDRQTDRQRSFPAAGMYRQINTGTTIVGSSGRGHGERQTDRDTDRRTQTDRQGEREIVSSCRAIEATE